MAISSWLDRRNTSLTIAAGVLCPILYLLYVNHYAVDVLQGDDWNMVPFVHQVLHGRFVPSQLWTQYGDSRIPIVKGMLLSLALVDRFNTRSIILFNAMAYIAAYCILLALCRIYLGRRLTPVPVLILGLVWFSLADVQGALWEFLMGDYLLVLFFVVMLFALNVATRRRTLWFSVGVFAAIMASMSTLSGFVAWPAGAICLVWARPRQRKALIELTAWTAVATVTTVVYFVGFNLQDTGCVRVLGCTPNAAVSHPLSGLHYFLVLIGNAIPSGYFSDPFAPSSYARFDVIGTALCLVAVYIGIQSWRERKSTERFPLPLLLIGTALAVDALAAIGRTGYGLSSAINGNRYEFWNIVLLSGIVVYAWSHLTLWRQRLAVHRKWARIAWLPIFGLAICLGIQIVMSTQFGLTNARLDQAWLVQGARLAVNLNEVPANERFCERAAYWIAVPSIIGEAHQDQLGEFQSDLRRYYRHLGPPPRPLTC
jgi:hypothetical protein